MVPNIDSRIVTDILSEPCRASLYHRLFVYWHVLNKSPSFWPSQTQSFATANAKLCNRQRKALHLPTQSFASVNANVFGERHDTYIICSRISVCMQQQQPKEKYRFISLPLRMFSLSLHHIGYVIGKTHTIRKSCGMSARILNKKRNPP